MYQVGCSLNLSAFAFAEDNFDRTFIKSKFFSESVDQITMIGKVNFLGIVSDNGKRWRLAGYLGCIKEFDASPPVQCGRM